MFAQILRPLTAALVAAAVMTPAASAEPLAGTGEDIQPIARVPLSHPNEVELAGDWAFVSNDQAGLWIVNVADPANPYVQGKWECEAGWADVDISPDSNLVALTNAHSGECFDDATAVVLIDTTDKSNPKLAGRISYEMFGEQAEPVGDYVHTSTLDGDRIFLNPQAAAFYPQDPATIKVFDISNPAQPKEISRIEGRGAGLAHDSYVDHRPDGKTLLYAASVHTSEVFDISDVMEPVLLQQTASPEITISHDVQPNHDRSMIVVDDEGAAGGQLDENVSACGRVGGPGPAAVDSGSVHFYAAAADGTFANGGAVELGSWNAPTNVNTGACVAHVFWQAPDENRLTQAYYRTGAFILDFEDPANVEMLGSFLAEGGANYWSMKPHRGYLFATSQEHGLDILRYTGEGGQRWPATAGPAEIQHAARQGVPYVPIAVAGERTLPEPPATEERRIGRVAFTARLRRVPGRRGRKMPVTLLFRDAERNRVARVKVRRKAGRKARIRVAGGAVAGRYSWLAKVGRRTVGRGRFSVEPHPEMKLSPGVKMAVTAR